jgi:uracil phosphoribosyltransferase
MKPENLEDLLRYRVGQAHETLHEAEILLSASALRGVVNIAEDALADARIFVAAIESHLHTTGHLSAE